MSWIYPPSLFLSLFFPVSLYFWLRALKYFFHLIFQANIWSYSFFYWIITYWVLTMCKTVLLALDADNISAVSTREKVPVLSVLTFQWRWLERKKKRVCIDHKSCGNKYLAEKSYFCSMKSFLYFTEPPKCSYYLLFSYSSYCLLWHFSLAGPLHCLF